MADAENDSKDTEKDSSTGPVVEGSNDDLEIGDAKPISTTTEQNEVRREVTDIKIFC